jgi:hypothetical protein
MYPPNPQLVGQLIKHYKQVHWEANVQMASLCILSMVSPTFVLCPCQYSPRLNIVVTNSFGN